jgi:hypothetical protein
VVEELVERDVYDVYVTNEEVVEELNQLEFRLNEMVNLQI